jgi:hypothetical protein
MVDGGWLSQGGLPGRDRNVPMVNGIWLMWGSLPPGFCGAGPHG